MNKNLKLFTLAMLCLTGAVKTSQAQENISANEKKYLEKLQKFSKRSPSIPTAFINEQINFILDQVDHYDDRKSIAKSFSNNDLPPDIVAHGFTPDFQKIKDVSIPRIIGNPDGFSLSAVLQQAEEANRNYILVPLSRRQTLVLPVEEARMLNDNLQESHHSHQPDKEVACDIILFERYYGEMKAAKPDDHGPNKVFLSTELLLELGQEEASVLVSHESTHATIHDFFRKKDFSDLKSYNQRLKELTKKDLLAYNNQMVNEQFADMVSLDDAVIKYGKQGFYWLAAKLDVHIVRELHDEVIKSSMNREEKEIAVISRLEKEMTDLRLANHHRITEFSENDDLIQITDHPDLMHRLYYADRKNIMSAAL